MKREPTWSDDSRQSGLAILTAERRPSLQLAARTHKKSLAMWKGSGRTLFQALVLENSKFVLFVITPIVTASIFWNDWAVEAIVRNRQYVTYPPEGARPPQNQSELEVALREQRAKAAARKQAASGGS